jgi:hypothetical protein
MTGFLSPSFIFNLKSQLSLIQEKPFQEFLNSENAWWPYVAKILPTNASKHIVTWLLQTAYLENLGQSTDLPKRDLVLVDTSFTPVNVGSRIEIGLNEFTDLDGRGVDILSSWVEQISQEGAYYPQEQIANLIKGGESYASDTYDGVAFFAKNHPYNPKHARAGTYANLFSSTAASTPSTDPNDAIYPGALPIDTGVTFEVAYANLQKAFGYINSIRQANGKQPRFLRPWAILAPSVLHPRVNALLQASFGGFTAGSGGGSTDLTDGGKIQIQKLGYQESFNCPEFNADSTSWYIIAKQVASSQLGGTVWTERQPIGTQTYWPTDGKNADLGRKNVVEAQSRGRSVAGFGHPYLVFKCKAT